MREINFPYLEVSWILVLLLPLLFIRVNKWLMPFFVYSWLSVISVVETASHRTDFPIKLVLAAENGAWSYFALLMIFAYLMKVKIPTAIIEELLAWLGAVNIVVTTLLVPVNEPFISGLVMNKSMNAIFNLMLLPYVMIRFKSLALLFLCLATVFVSDSSTVLLSVVLMTLYFFRKSWKLSVVFAVVCVVVGSFTMHKLFQYQDRLDGWLFFFDSFTPSDWILGRGPGSFFSFGSYEQHLYGFEVSKDLSLGNGLFIWLHNDYLQALYEFGAIGVLTLLPVPIYLTRNLKGPAAYSLIALASGSLLYYPIHWPLHLVVVFCLLKISDNNYRLSHGKSGKTKKVRSRNDSCD